jgi:phosphomevalonate kinase
LTVATTAALLSHYKSDLQLANQQHLQLIHNLAQVAHCTAQGKVGSGFDIASAVFGSVLYRRFPPDLLNTAGIFETTAPDYSYKIKKLVDSQWDMQLEPCALPSGLSLLMGDVKGGSETPSMVKTVLAWRKDHPQRANEVWTALNNANMSMVQTLSQLAACSQSDTTNSYKKSLLLQQLKNNFLAIRKYLQIMTKESGAAIEPISQTELLDSCYKLDGVYGGVVPGAGGYDAISLVVDSTKVEDIKSAGNTVPLISDVSWLQLKEQTVGLQVELVDTYPQY